MRNGRMKRISDESCRFSGALYVSKGSSRFAGSSLLGLFIMFFVAIFMLTIYGEVQRELKNMMIIRAAMFA